MHSSLPIPIFVPRHLKGNKSGKGCDWLGWQVFPALVTWFGKGKRGNSGGIDTPVNKVAQSVLTQRLGHTEIFNDLEPSAISNRDNYTHYILKVMY